MLDAVLFDLDGTLADTAPDVGAATNRVLEEEGRPALPLATLRPYTSSGPDDFGYYCDDNISLGHRRLAIQDLSANGHQPMLPADGRYVIVFNGEIYNHWDVRKNLVAKYTFKSTSDTETILYGFQEYGVDIFNQLNGIFAICILDTQNGQLTIARDQFGVKPLYYVRNSQCLAFASEIKSLQQIPKMDLSIDENSLANYLYFLWSPGEDTPFEHVKKLRPGCV